MMISFLYMLHIAARVSLGGMASGLQHAAVATEAPMIPYSYLSASMGLRSDALNAG
jgi:hypothetical protein